MAMADNFEHILDECIDRINRGESLASCLADYPQYHEQLEPLLRVMFQTKEAYSFQPSAEVKKTARQRFNHARKELARAREEKQPLFHGVLAWPRAWVTVAASVFTLFILIGGIAVASNNSMPGGLLYPVKITTEQARLALIFSEDEKARLHITFAESRVEEITEISQRGQVEQVPELTQTLVQHVEEAGQVISAIDESQVAQELKADLGESADQQLAILEEVWRQSTEDTKLLLTQTLEASAESYGTALEATMLVAAPPSLIGKVGTIQILVTDPPLPEGIESILVQVASMEVHLVAGADSGWVNIMDQPRSFDLMELLGGKEVDLGSMEVNAGTYTQVRAEITRATVIAGGEEHDAVIPSGKLKFVRPFQVKEDLTTSLILDFDGEKSINVNQEGQYMLKPVVTLLVPKKESPPDKTEKEEAEEVKFEGIIETIAGTIWTITDEGETMMVDVSGAEIEGEPIVGLEARVEGVLIVDIVLASEVWIREVKEVKFEGIIETIVGAIWTITDEGETMTVDVSGAEIEGEPVVGLEARAEGTLVDGTILAREVWIRRAKEVKFEGIIETIVGAIWTITDEGETMTVDVSGAEIEGEPVVGLEARVKGTLVDGTILANEVWIREVEEEEAGDEEFNGTILDSTDDAWTIDIDDVEWTVDVSEAEIEGEPEAGLSVEVKGTVVDTNTIKASKVEIKD